MYGSADGVRRPSQRSAYHACIQNSARRDLAKYRSKLTLALLQQALNAMKKGALVACGCASPRDAGVPKPKAPKSCRRAWPRYTRSRSRSTACLLPLRLPHAPGLAGAMPRLHGLLRQPSPRLKDRLCRRLLPLPMHSTARVAQRGPHLFFHDNRHIFGGGRSAGHR